MGERIQLKLMTYSGVVDASALLTGTPGLYVAEDGDRWLLVHGRSGCGLVFGLPSAEAAMYCALLLGGLGDWALPDRELTPGMDFELLDYIAVECGGWPTGGAEEPELNPHLGPVASSPAGEESR